MDPMYLALTAILLGLTAIPLAGWAAIEAVQSRRIFQRILVDLREIQGELARLRKQGIKIKKGRLR